MPLSPSLSPPLSLPLDLPAALTPMMAQYWALKRAHADCLLFFRMGDFYELFFDDAIRAAPILDVALTRRGTAADGENIPMCGVPVHAYESYLPRLIQAGLRVAIAEQMEDPATAKKRARETGGGKALVDRQVIRILTPGTLTEETFLAPQDNHYLAVLAEQGGQYALAWVDLSAAAPLVAEVDGAELPGLLARINPQELVLAQRVEESGVLADFVRAQKERISTLPNSRFDSESAKKAVLQHYGVASLDAFGNFSRLATTALGLLVDYIALTQKQQTKVLAPPRLEDESRVLAMDPATRRNLELHATLSGERKGSLLATIDRTLTHAGARLLSEHLAAPLTDRAAIEQRLARITSLLALPALREKLREGLGLCPDLARAFTRLSLKRGGPRDLQVVQKALECAAALRFVLHAHASSLDAGLQALAEQLGEHSALTDHLAQALKPELPMLARDGGFIAAGFSPQLDTLVGLRDDSKQLIATLQAKYSHETKITGLKIRHNYVIGYHVDVTPSQADKLLAAPFNETFIHRQTLTSGVRFSTRELAELEAKVSESAERALQLELQLFEALAQAVLARQAEIRAAAMALAQLDVVAALAELAASEHWCKPELEDGFDFYIEKGRHPVVEASLRAQDHAAFVPNDCALAPEKRLWLVTGPNMAGKSTFLRQQALFVILAQMGSYVPAQQARLGVVDKLFSRVGAADDLARGRSTFMVEMMETAAILHQATRRSLVILDEIGRGTATFDGLSIAWACVEYLYHHNQCRALFATHYHELTALKAQLPSICCATAKVREWNNDIIFLHEVGEGVADRSYGIHVAKLAGLPAPVIIRAQTILAELENSKTDHAATIAATAYDPSMRHPSVAPASTPLEEALAALNPDELSPKEALEKLYALKKLK